VEIAELSADEVRAAADELAQLLLDAHASNMALGLRGPLTREHARETWLDTATRLDPERRVLLAALEDGAVVGTVQVVRAEAENGQHRAEIVRLAVRGDRRGGGIGKTLLEAAAERARGMGLRVLWLSTHAGTASDRFYEAAGWSRVGELPLYSERPDGTLVGSAFYFREL
jgi:GNAT superfamily N-acetyltransferase